MSNSSVLLPSTRYHDGVTHHRWQEDPAQQAALAAFDQLHTTLTQASQPNGNGLFGRLRQFWHKPQPEDIKGIYIWGRVGRGKTFLMDLFVASLPSGMVRRRHFHQFMQEVHAELRDLTEHEDPLKLIARELAQKVRVLCLDEFLVDDIGDAMILYGLLKNMIDNDVALVTTSNTPPHKLYKDGLQRARFMPAIALLQNHCQVIELDSRHDWRLRTLEQAAIYQTPPGAEATRALTRIFRDYAKGTIRENTHVEIAHRQISVYQLADNIAWFTFAAVCDGPRSRADYVELAQIYAAIIIANVPVFTRDNHEQAKRFIHLVDAFYDQGVKLILSAAAPIIDLYEGERLRAEFGRTESRLIEMQSEDYLQRKHRAPDHAALV